MALGRHRGARAGAARSARVRRRPDAGEAAIVRIGAKDGLFDEVIHQILEDDAGRLWMNTNRGIFWVARAELNAFADGKVSRVHSTAYTERDGMRNREGNGGVQPAGAKGLDGRLWFPTQDGVVVVDPAKVRRDQRAPPLVVEQVVAGGGALRPEHDSIALGPNERDVQIEYTALTFLEPTNVRFRYRLDPYDAGWVDVGNRRTAFYTKVPPGRYTFRRRGERRRRRVVRAGNQARRASPSAGLGDRRLSVVSVAALGMLLFAAVRLREARLRARAVQLERVVDERTAALREREQQLADRNAQLQSLDHAKTRFFANVSHELRTPLTLTIGPLEDLRARAGGDPQVERWLDIALRNARRLLRLVNQILDVAKLEAGAMHLAPRPLDLGPVHARRGRRLRAGRRAKGDPPDGGDGRGAARRIRRRRRREDPDQPPLERHQVHAERRDGARRALEGWRIGAARWCATPARAFLPIRSPTSSSDSTRWTSRRRARSRARGSGSRW